MQLALFVSERERVDRFFSTFAISTKVIVALSGILKSFHLTSIGVCCTKICDAC